MMAIAKNTSWKRAGVNSWVCQVKRPSSIAPTETPKLTVSCSSTPPGPQSQDESVPSGMQKASAEAAARAWR